MSKHHHTYHPITIDQTLDLLAKQWTAAPRIRLRTAWHRPRHAGRRTWTRIQSLTQSTLALFQHPSAMETSYSISF
jgi:hypothetical protein